MCDSHDHLVNVKPLKGRLLANAVAQYDPTRTLTLRNKFAQEMRVRFNKLASDVVKTVDNNDAFGLKVNAPADPGQFAFARSDQKIAAFMDWLKEREEEYILSGGARGFGITLRQDGVRAIEQAWTNVYIDSAYRRGIRRGLQELEKVGVNLDPERSLDDKVTAAFNQPVHADRVGVLFARTFGGLVGITENLNLQISQILAEGMVDGSSPRVIARRLNKIITGQGDDLGLTDSLGRYIPARRRAELLARTEIIRAHHLANIQEYRNAGILNVKVLAEFTTAGDDRVCTKCESLNGRIYTLDEIEGLIPVHPQCRCIALPVVTP